MEVQQQHSPVGVGPLDFSRRGVAEASAFRVVKPKQSASSLVHQQALSPETNNNENSLQENPQIPVETEGKKMIRRENYSETSSILRYRFARIRTVLFENWWFWTLIALTNNRKTARNNNVYRGYCFNGHQTELELSFAVSNRSYVTVSVRSPVQIGISVSNLVTNEPRYTLVICHPPWTHKGYNYHRFPNASSISIPIPIAFKIISDIIFERKSTFNPFHVKKEEKIERSVFLSRCKIWQLVELSLEDLDIVWELQVTLDDSMKRCRGNEIQLRFSNWDNV